MDIINNAYIKLKDNLNLDDYNEITQLQKLCFEVDQTTLKLELDFKFNFVKNNDYMKNINEFMYYNQNKLIGYIGICQFGKSTIEVNGMVHPEFRRCGIFTKLFSLVNDEWIKRESTKMLLISDHNSISGLSFINSLNANYEHSEYDMYLKSDHPQLLSNQVNLRKATKEDAMEIVKQNSLYYNIESSDADILLLEDTETRGMLFYMAEVDQIIIGKVKLELNDEVGSIHGLGVIPQYRRKGYGKMIINQAIGMLKERNYHMINLQVDAKNENALKIYKDCGFEETSITDYYEIIK